MYSNIVANSIYLGTSSTLPSGYLINLKPMLLSSSTRAPRVAKRRMAWLDQTAWGISMNFTFVLIIAFGEIVPLLRFEFEYKA